ncbi:MAG: hypothetical protein HN368_05740 [Spirochaetales bacterium]|jgi:hypothetical protein|nr:hypothetical protein [Spirochaetales bacterium]
MNYQNHLYMILYPHTVLIASQLEPRLLAQHYTAGSSRHYRGKVIFAEIDLDYRNDFFKIEDILSTVEPHEDGRPKATKYISSYRVLEHVEFSSIMRLYLSTQEGYCIGIDSGPFEFNPEDKQARIFAEITPLRALVLSKVDFITFGRYITNFDNPKSAPSQFFTQLDLDIVDFLEEFGLNPFRPAPFLNVHPSILRDAFYELQRHPEKLHRGIAIDSDLVNISYKLIRRGFMFANQESSLFFPMPEPAVIEEENYKFWRTM